MWGLQSPLQWLVSNREIKWHGLHLNNKVADLARNGQLVWPSSLTSSFPVFNLINSPVLTNNDDELVWKAHLGELKPFSISMVWDTIRSRNVVVPWHGVVWFAQCIHRHAFHMWLIMLRRLKTQDLMRQWDVSSNTNLNLLRCSLCKLQPDSHDHLFFQCPYAKQVWELVKLLGGMENCSATWSDIVARLCINAHRNSVVCVISRTGYFIWQERNNRLFGKGIQSVRILRDVIVTTVRLKLLTMKFKNMMWAKTMIDKWKLPRGVVI